MYMYVWVGFTKLCEGGVSMQENTLGDVWIKLFFLIHGYIKSWMFSFRRESIKKISYLLFPLMTEKEILDP